MHTILPAATPLLLLEGWNNRRYMRLVSTLRHAVSDQCTDMLSVSRLTFPSSPFWKASICRHGCLSPVTCNPRLCHATFTCSHPGNSVE